MDATRSDLDERRETTDIEERCACDKGKGEEESDGICYVLMNSVHYGTEVWPCASLDEAVETLARLARSAEQHRREDGIQRYFCIRGELPEENGAGMACDPASPDSPDTDATALTLTIHLRETPRPAEQDVRTCLRRLSDEIAAEQAEQSAMGTQEVAA